MATLTNLYKRVKGELETYSEMLATSNFDKDLFDGELRIRFKNEQEKRIEQLQTVINNHLLTLLRGTKKENANVSESELLEKYKKYTFIQKLKLLQANNSKLMHAAEGHGCLRMQGTTQSYHMYDSQ